MVGEILHLMHDIPTGGHLGSRRLLAGVRQRFYWIRLNDDIERHCQTCDKCGARKVAPKQVRAPLKQYQVGAPLERMAIDILGPMPVTEKGNKYILVVGDYFTKWMEALPLPDQEAHTVADALVNRFSAELACLISCILIRGEILNPNSSGSCASNLALTRHALVL